MRVACARLLYAGAYSGCSVMRLPSKARAFWISGEEGEALLRGRMIRVSRLWRVGRSAGGV